MPMKSLVADDWSSCVLLILTHPVALLLTIAKQRHSLPVTLLEVMTAIGACIGSFLMDASIVHLLEMTQESNAELEKLEQRLIEAESAQEIRDNEKEKVSSALDILKEIIDKKELTHADLTMLIDKIVVYERKSEGLDIEVEWNTPFMVVSE